VPRAYEYRQCPILSTKAIGTTKYSRGDSWVALV
jgi:hypothetical protein